MAPDLDTVRDVASRQSDVVTRARLIELGATPRWISHQVNTTRWQRLFPGTYVVHSGPASWRTRAVAALAYAGAGAALSHASAGYVHRIVAEPPRQVEVSVPHRRRVTPQAGLVIVRRRAMPPSSGWLRAITPEHAVLDLVARARGVDDVVGLLCAAARLGVAPRSVLTAVGDRPQMANRSLLLELLSEVDDGVESPLECRYRRDVERRHGLPVARLQVRDHVGGYWIRSDALYEGFGVRTELDGLLAHPEERRATDVWRDNAVLVERGDITLRYRWQHVAGRPCAVAAQVAAALTARGWTERPRACGPRCPVGHG